MILIERQRLQAIEGVSHSTIANAISRKRLVEGDAFELRRNSDEELVPGRRVRGVTFGSAADYWRWSPAVQDEIMRQHGLHPDDTGDWLFRAIYRKDTMTPAGEFVERLYLADRIKPVPATVD